MKKIFLLCIISFAFYTCDLCPNNHGAEELAKDFLVSIKKGEFEKAKVFCTRDVANYIGSCRANSIQVNLSEDIEVKCRSKERKSMCSFCSTQNYYLMLELECDGVYRAVSWVPGMKRKPQ